jgi:histone H3/H4
MVVSKDRKRQLLNTPDLGKILKKGGVGRAKRDIIDTINAIGEKFVKDILHSTVLIALSGGKQITVKLSHLQAACDIAGIKSSVGFSPTAQVTPSLVTGKGYSRKSSANSEDGKKTRKFKQSTVMAREITYIQRKDNLVFKKLTFKKFIQQSVKDSKSLNIQAFDDIDMTKLRFSNDISVVLQVICEKFLISLAHAASMLAANAKQKTVTSTHINSAVQIVRECGMFFQLM